jgi:hypothetical protein
MSAPRASSVGGVSCATLWIGDRLGPVERACLRSVLRQGHELSLYCYREPAGVPAGVELREAEEIVPESQVIRHHTGSVSLFSNRFRYELQRRGRGIWVDCDAYLLAPLDTERPYLYGEWAPGRIAAGILRLPPDSPVLSPLLAIFDEREVPPWLPWRARIAARRRLRRTGRTGLAQMPWGSAGPAALTALLHEHGLAGRALAPDVLYPVHWDRAAWIADPGLALEDMVSERTVSLHLFNECIKGFKHEPAPAGSFLARLQTEGEEHPPASLPRSSVD